MARHPESSPSPESPRHRFGLTRWLVVGVGCWIAFEALGSVLAFARHLVVLAVLVVVVGWRIARARKS